MRFILVLALVLRSASADASGFKMGGIGGGSPGTNPDCGQLTPIEQTFPDWSRSWGLGWAGRPDRTEWRNGAAVSAQASWQFLATEAQCKPGTGWFSSKQWRRLSLAGSLDVLWRNIEDQPIDLRPGLRFSRAIYDVGMFTIGSHYVPSFELALIVGPTFTPAWSGAAASVQGRFSFLTAELRGAWRSETNGAELVLLFGVTDLHGLVKIGPRRETI
jgi:hypothetical protein